MVTLKVLCVSFQSFGSISKENSLNKIAKIVVASKTANFSPIQFLGPFYKKNKYISVIKST